MMLYASSCERPSKSSPSVFLPSSVSNSYSFSTRTQGSSRRFLWISSFSSACSPSSFASSSRAACHSSWVPILCSDISKPPVGLERYLRVGVAGCFERELLREPVAEGAIELRVVTLVIGRRRDPPADVHVVLQQLLGQLGAPAHRIQVAAP